MVGTVPLTLKGEKFILNLRDTLQFRPTAIIQPQKRLWARPNRLETEPLRLDGDLHLLADEQRIRHVAVIRIPSDIGLKT